MFSQAYICILQLCCYLLCYALFDLKYENTLKIFYKNFKYRICELNMKFAWVFYNERRRYSYEL